MWQCEIDKSLTYCLLNWFVDKLYLTLFGNCHMKNIRQRKSFFYHIEIEQKKKKKKIETVQQLQCKHAH